MDLRKSITQFKKAVFRIFNVQQEEQQIESDSSSDIVECKSDCSVCDTANREISLAPSVSSSKSSKQLKKNEIKKTEIIQLAPT